MNCRNWAIVAAALLLPPGTALAAPLEIFHNRLFVAVDVNGIAVTALLDSGAEMTIMDDDLAARLALSQSGEATAHGSGASPMRAKFIENLSMSAVGVALTKQTAAVLDLGDISDRLVGRPVEMILGRNLFDAARLVIDIEDGEIRTLSPETAPIGRRYELTPHRGIETFPVLVEGNHLAQAAFDLGNGSEVMIGRAYADQLGVTAPERVIDRRRGGGLGGEVERDIILLKSLEVGGRVFQNVPATIDDSPSAADLNVGTSILRHFLITTDFSDRAIWLADRAHHRTAAD